jgi:Domain of unknown function (DU1801)
MSTTALTVKDYLANISLDKQEATKKLYNIFKKNLPRGYAETMQYGMITFVVPHSKYPSGYHCKPIDALPFVSIAAQKNFIAVYHMGIYGLPTLLSWFTSEFPKHSNSKLDMSKSCIRFKKIADIPFDLLKELASKITVDEWVTSYETLYKKK